MDYQDLVPPVLTSLKVSVVSSLIVFALGAAAAWGLSRRRFAGKALVETVFMLPLVLPPTVVGFILLLLLGKKSWIGRLAEVWLSAPIVFTWQAAVVASVVVSFPLVYQTAKTGFASVDRDLEDAARSMGAGEVEVLRWITLPLAGRALTAAYILGFSRGLGEFGATLMVAGNIPNKTQTLPTAIYLAVEAGHVTEAWWWTVTIMVISFLMLLLVSRKNH